MACAASRSAAQNWLRNHWRDSPAARVQLITVHFPGTAEQKVCTRPLGSMVTLSAWAKMTPEVPRVVKAFPASTTPVPMAAAALSPAPPTTMVPGARPVASAAADVTAPVTSQDSYIRPRSPGSMSSAASTSPLH